MPVKCDRYKRPGQDGGVGDEGEVEVQGDERRRIRIGSVT
jgi:hypothetical protein